MNYSHSLFGIIFMLLNTLSLSFLDMTSKYLKLSMNSSHIVFLYKSLLFLIILPWVFKDGIRNIHSAKLHIHLIRSFFSVAGSLAFIKGLQYVSLADASALENVQYMILVFAGMIFFKESVTKTKIFALVIGILGCIIVVKPTILSSIYAYYVLGAPDFNFEVFEAMNGCLACKSCSSQCPVGVDVPDFRAKFLAIYYSKYLRPLKDYFVANVESLAPMMAKAPRLFNFLVQNRPSEWLLKNAIGYVDTPALSTPKLIERTLVKPYVVNNQHDLNQLASLSDEAKKQHVLIVQDPFTSFYDADVIEHLVKFLKNMGKTPVLLPFSPNGKPQHVKGFLDKFEKTARSTASFLSSVHQLGIQMIGADASLVLCYRDEYTKLLGNELTNFSVLTVTEWLKQHAHDFNLSGIQGSNTQYKLLAHCSEKTALPETEATWKQVFAQFGLQLNVEAVGCCGMAGTYGHEAEHLENSTGIYNLSWQTAAKVSQNEEIVVTGYSCRSQVKRFEKYRPKHPIEVLAAISAV